MSYYEQMFPDKAMYEQDAILAGLPTGLREDVLMDVYKPVLHVMSFIPDEIAEDPESQDIRKAFCLAFRLTSFLKGEEIGRQGMYEDAIYSVLKGQVEVLKDNKVSHRPYNHALTGIYC
eukprot:SAG22_NODE_1661_length_3868_cov_5.701512_3_plen_119_part_00